MSGYSLEALERAACLGKVGYQSAGHAKRVLRVMLRSRAFKADRGERLCIFRCRFCKGLHIGNEDRKPKARSAEHDRNMAR